MGKNNSGDDVALGHIVFINNATGTTRDSVYFTSYNTNWKNKLFSQRYSVNTENTLAGLYVIVPKTFKNGSNGTRLWADLQNSLPINSSVPIKGYSNVTCSTFKVQIYNTAGTLVKTSTYNNVSSVSISYTMDAVGAWRVVLTGTDSSGTEKSFTYMVRIY